MPYPFPPDVKRRVAEYMATGQFQSEDDLLREALAALAEEEEDLRAVQEAIADLEAGDEGTPLHDAFMSLRTRDGIASQL